jgi:hypothetical protein
MRILVGVSEEALPKDILNLNEMLRDQYRSWASSLPQAAKPFDWRGLNLAAPPEGLPGPKADSLNQSNAAPVLPLQRWQIEAHAYVEEQATKISILGRLFSGEAKKVKAGVIHEAKRFSELETESIRKVEVGVAVRLAVATSSTKINFGLTLPNIAADAQLNGAEARVGITVIGYTGPLGDLLPAPRKLDVETCGEYLDAFRKLQAKIFSEEGWQYVSPTTLSFDN